MYLGCLKNLNDRYHSNRMVTGYFLAKMVMSYALNPGLFSSKRMSCKAALPCESNYANYAPIAVKFENLLNY